MVGIMHGYNYVTEECYFFYSKRFTKGIGINVALTNSTRGSDLRVHKIWCWGFKCDIIRTYIPGISSLTVYFFSIVVIGKLNVPFTFQTPSATHTQKKNFHSNYYCIFKRSLPLSISLLLRPFAGLRPKL